MVNPSPSYLATANMGGVVSFLSAISFKCCILCACFNRYLQ
jgi:hypothetical protein